MLEWMHRLAVWLARFRIALVTVAVSAALVGVFALFLLDSAQGDRLLFPALVLFTWSFLFVVFADAFARVPGPPDPSWGRWRRWRRKSVRGLYWLLAVGTIVMVLVAVHASQYIVREWLDDAPPSHQGHR
ncbi:hypothetical protein ABC977_03230 [Thioalkalicoccus limnaeus]|uniref:Uncharacterized protein n=1 Tax=Thioalkalicoccus limnaeus TaxID=120681 RepID=A0ABV4BAQ8_9GAMM